MIKRFVLTCLILFIFITAALGCGKENITGHAQDLQILFVNVGKADSALVSFNNKHYLIDTGTQESLPRLVKALRSKGIKTLDGIFLSHTHEDHTGGLEGLLKLFDVKQIYASEITVNRKNGSNIVDEIAQSAGKSVLRLKINDTVTLDPAIPAVTFAVAGPAAYNADDDNDNSLVLYLINGSFSCLFTGDMQFSEEQSLLNANTLKPCTLLKVGNHGNPDASSHEFLAKVAPQYAVISTDSSVDQDTPSPTLLNELKNLSTKVFVTQDSKTGILANVHEGKTALEIYNAEEKPAAEGLKIESADKQAEALQIRNTGNESIDLSGGWIYSDRGGEMFVFPEHTVLAQDGLLTVASGDNKNNGDLYWDEKNVWHDKKTDTVIIYDRSGNMLCRQDL